MNTKLVSNLYLVIGLLAVVFALIDYRLIFVLLCFLFLMLLHVSNILYNQKFILCCYCINIIVIVFTLRNRGVDAEGFDTQLIIKTLYWLFCSFVVAINFIKDGLPRPSLVGRFFLVYLGVMWLSVTYSPNFFYSFSAVFVYTLIYFFTLLVLNKCSIDLISKWLINALFLFALISISGVVLFSDYVFQEYWSDEGYINGVRYKGLSSNGNEVGQVAAIMLILTLFFRKVHGLSSRYLFVIIGVGLVTLIMSWSRMSVIGFVAAVFVLYFYRKPLVVVFTLFALLSCMFVLYFFQDSVQNFLPFLSRGGGVEEIFSFTGRVYIWDAVSGLISDRPWFGYGYASSKTLLPIHFETPWGWTTVNSHSFYYQMILSTGYIGSIPIFIVLIYHFKKFFLQNSRLSSSIFVFIVFTGLLESGAYGPIPNFLSCIWMLIILLYEDK